MRNPFRREQAIQPHVEPQPFNTALHGGIAALVLELRQSQADHTYFGPAICDKALQNADNYLAIDLPRYDGLMLLAPERVAQVIEDNTTIGLELFKCLSTLRAGITIPYTHSGPTYKN